MCDDVKLELLAKHLQADPPKLPTSAAPSPVKINEAALIRALRSFPQGTAPGPSDLRADHLKEAVFCPSPRNASVALHSLCKFINLPCSGQVPSDVVPHFCGATLYGLKKKSDGLRPIAVGDVLCRLSSISKSVFSEASRLLSPRQKLVVCGSFSLSISWIQARLYVLFAIQLSLEVERILRAII